MLKKSKLEIEYDYDFDLLGINTQIRSYKLAWLINKALAIDLKADEDLKLDFADHSQLLLANYVHKTEYSTFRLIRNKSHEFTNIAKPYLVPELKEYDYLVHISNDSDVFNSHQVMNALKNLPGIVFITKVDTTRLKSKDNLIF